MLEGKKMGSVASRERFLWRRDSGLKGECRKRGAEEKKALGARSAIVKGGGKKMPTTGNNLGGSRGHRGFGRTNK